MHMIMNNVKFILTALVPVIAFFLLLGWAGDYDYCEQVILRMSQEQYDTVKSLLTERNGCEPSERDIAHWWVDNRESLP